MDGKERKKKSVMCRPELTARSERGQVLCMGEPEAP